MIKLLTAALEALVEYLRFKQRTFLYEIEDEMDQLAADGSPAAKLRLERLSQSRKIELQRTLRSTDSDPPAG